MQQINLYRGALLPQPEKLPAWTLLLSLLVGIVVTMLWWGLGWQTLHGKQQRLAQALSRQTDMNKQLLILQKSIPAAAVAARSEARIARLQLQLQRDATTLQLVEQLNANRRTGFAGVLTDLASLTNRKVWLTGIGIDGKGLTLDGKTLESSAVAHLVGRLQTLPHTRSMHFGQLVIARKKPSHAVADFHLAPEAEANDATD